MELDQLTDDQAMELVREFFPSARLLEEIHEPHLIPIEGSNGRRYLIDSETRKMVKVLDEG